MSQETETFDHLPDAIIARLRARDRGLALLTPAVDQSIDAAARVQFATRRARPAVHRWTVPFTAVAAAALVAIFVGRSLDEAPVVPEAQQIADDVDGSGSVDILDAFALARAQREDPNRISQDSIDALMDSIVSL